LHYTRAGVTNLLEAEGYYIGTEKYQELHQDLFATNFLNITTAKITTVIIMITIVVIGTF